MVENRDYAVLCECGSVSFALRKDKKLECTSCTETQDDKSWIYGDTLKEITQKNEIIMSQRQEIAVLTDTY